MIEMGSYIVDAAPLAFFGTLIMLFGYEVPIAVFMPNFPFELAIGVWLLVKGINNEAWNKKNCRIRLKKNI